MCASVSVFLFLFPVSVFSLFLLPLGKPQWEGGLLCAAHICFFFQKPQISILKIRVLLHVNGCFIEFKEPRFMLALD